MTPQFYDFLTNWMIFFFLSSTWLSDLVFSADNSDGNQIFQSLNQFESALFNKEGLLIILYLVPLLPLSKQFWVKKLLFGSALLKGQLILQKSPTCMSPQYFYNVLYGCRQNIDNFFETPVIYHNLPYQIEFKMHQGIRQTKYVVNQMPYAHWPSQKSFYVRRAVSYFLMMSLSHSSS